MFLRVCLVHRVRLAAGAFNIIIIERLVIMGAGGFSVLFGNGVIPGGGVFQQVVFTCTHRYISCYMSFYIFHLENLSHIIQWFSVLETKWYNSGFSN